MTTYVVVGISVLFAMLGNVIWWKSEKVDNFIYPTFLGWGVTGAIITVTLIFTKIKNKKVGI